jgi:hypothetical protein
MRAADSFNPRPRVGGDPTSTLRLAPRPLAQRGAEHGGDPVRETRALQRKRGGGRPVCPARKLAHCRDRHPSSPLPW